MAETISKDVTVRDFVVAHPQARKTLEELGIDYCCGGARPLGEAAEAAGRPWALVQTELGKALAAPSAEAAAERDWRDASLTELADHIEQRHHTFMREQLPRIERLLATVQRAHGKRHGEMLAQLQEIYGMLRSEIEDHLMKEEQILFPYIRQIEAYSIGGGERPHVHCGSVGNPIRQMEFEHDHAGDALARMRDLTSNYAPPPDACDTFCALYEAIAAMEEDLHEHIHLENNILFPRAVALEKSSGVCP